MLKRLSTMPGTVTIILLWVAVWVLVITKNCLPVLSGKGISIVGNECYRFFTAGLTHANLIHLLANVSAMFWIGYFYEHSLGTMKFVVIGMFCAILSYVIFLCIYHNANGSIGGSVYNFALCGFGLTLQFLVSEFPKIILGTRCGNWLVIYLIASNIPFLPYMDITTVILHTIAFATGIVVALVCRLLRLKLPPQAASMGKQEPEQPK